MDKKSDRTPNKSERLEEALLTFIEREAKNTSPEAASVSAIPAMAGILVKLWGF